MHLAYGFFVCLLYMCVCSVGYHLRTTAITSFWFKLSYQFIFFFAYEWFACVCGLNWLLGRGVVMSKSLLFSLL